MIASYLNGRQRGQGEELSHPQLKVQAEAVEEGPNVHQFTRSEPQSSDNKGADCSDQLLEDSVMISANVVIDIP